MKTPHIFSIVLLAGASSVSAAIVSFVGGDTADGFISGSPGNIVVDFGYNVPATNSIEPVLFETGGDGIGFMLAHVGDNLRVFQDQNAGAEAALSLDISGFSGQVISIRLDGNFTLANGSRMISLDVSPTSGAPISVSQMNITSSDARLSGSDPSGFGGINASISGHAEAPSGVMGFDVPERDINGPGSSVLGPDSLMGIYYNGTDADSQRLTQLPSAESYTFVPEPSTALLLVIAGLGLAGRRRR